MLKNLRVRVKIMLISASLLMLLAATGITGYYFFSESNKEMHRMFNSDFRSVQYLYDVKVQLEANEATVLHIILNAGNAQELEKYIKDVNGQVKRNNDGIAAFEAIGELDQNEKDALNVLKTNQAEFRKAREQVIQLAKDGKAKEAYSLFEDNRKYLDAYQNAAADLVNYNVKEAEDLKALNDKEYKSSERDYVIILVIAFLLGGILSLLVSRAITEPLYILTKAIKTVATGDFSVVIPKKYLQPKDELGDIARATDKMIEEQSEIIHCIRDGAAELAGASGDISASSQEISASTEEISCSIQEVATNAERQSGSVLETSEVLVQLSSLIQIAQRKALTARKNSGNTMDAARHGRENVKGTVAAIENINNVSSETENTLNELDALSKKVSGIIDTINNISSQTNLLALNAAIEAARAGEHGKGFTVVADEVRKLSVQTNTGANEISSLIKEMIIQIDKAVKSMNSSKQAVEGGVAVAKGTDESFISIINAVEQITKDIEQIVEITKDEVASSDQILKLIDSVAAITETTTANSQEVAAAAEEQSSAVENLATSAEQTNSMANSFNELVKKYKIRGVEK